MDPNANLNEQREISNRIVHQVDQGVTVDPRDSERLAELVIALDQWIQKGGFMPRSWYKAVTK